MSIRKLQKKIRNIQKKQTAYNHGVAFAASTTPCSYTKNSNVYNSFQIQFNQHIVEYIKFAVVDTQQWGTDHLSCFVSVAIKKIGLNEFKRKFEIDPYGTMKAMYVEFIQYHYVVNKFSYTRASRQEVKDRILNSKFKLSS